MSGVWDDGERPHDKLTLQEARLAVASLAGPLRANIAGRTQTRVLQDRAALQVAMNRQAPVLFVQLRAHPRFAAPVILVGGEQNVSEDNHETIDLQIGPYQQILLEAEELWVRPVDAGVFRIQVTEVTP